jgi:hypothetical protein
MVGGVPIVLGPLGHRVVEGGHQGSVHDEHGVRAEPLAGLKRQQRTEAVDCSASRGL